VREEGLHLVVALSAALPVGFIATSQAAGHSRLASASK
jgi:hypothetical protein